MTEPFAGPAASTQPVRARRPSLRHSQPPPIAAVCRQRDRHYRPRARRPLLWLHHPQRLHPQAHRPTRATHPVRVWAGIRARARPPRSRWTTSKRCATARRTFRPIAAGSETTVMQDGATMMGLLVTGDFFQVLRVQPVMGRVLTPADAAAPGQGAVVVLSNNVWRARYGGDPAIVGKTIVLRQQRFDVVGVLPRGSSLPGEELVGFYVPLTMAGAFDVPDPWNEASPPSLFDLRTAHERRDRIAGPRLGRRVAASAISGRVGISTHGGSRRASRQTHSSRWRRLVDGPADHVNLRAGAARGVRQCDESGAGPRLRPAARDRGAAVARRPAWSGDSAAHDRESGAGSTSSGARPGADDGDRAGVSTAHHRHVSAACHSVRRVCSRRSIPTGECSPCSRSRPLFQPCSSA